MTSPSKAAHTAATLGPWAVQPFNGDQVHNLSIVSCGKKTPNYLPIATMCGCHVDTPANAAFIVRACNSHDALLEALRRLLDACDGTAIDETEEFAAAKSALLAASTEAPL